MGTNDESQSVTENVELIKRQATEHVEASQSILEQLGLNIRNLSQPTRQKLDHFSSVFWDLRLRTNEPNTVTAFREKTWLSFSRISFTTMLKLHVHELKTWLDVSRMLNSRVVRLSEDYEKSLLTIEGRLKKVDLPTHTGKLAESKYTDDEQVSKRKTLQAAIIAKCRDLSTKKTRLDKINTKLEQYFGLPTDLEAAREKIKSCRKELESVRESYEAYFNASQLNSP
ncbi:Hypothetical protein NTJ_12543 [Nesidiocoris tenuis]|uniref:Uncharacterized protein n=1 Tax=Nesidiocoris tenuis TaxID=355587 RepID=A0ABN7B5P0_9HEMI|nr:Hypothetical protein NTJ_12543 [Nesidiocoris tenuis]